MSSRPKESRGKLAPDYSPAQFQAQCPSDDCGDTRRPLVAEATEALHKNLCQLRETVEALRQRLSPVMRNEPDCDSCEKKCEPAMACELAATIGGYASAAATVNELLRDVLRLLEI